MPKGFIERTSGIGLVIQAWAPQPVILAHTSVRCFITHYGWNSALESIMNVVPMIACPLHRTTYECFNARDSVGRGNSD
jgi:hypothetical protein